MTRRRPYELQGELATFPPALLFQMMALGGVNGLLRLRSWEGTCDVYFRGGKLVFARNGSQPGRVGEELIRRGLLQRADCEAAARERDRRPDGPRIGAILVQRGKIQRDELEAVVRDGIKDAIYRVVAWRDGRFTFEAGVEPSEEDILLDVQLESLLLECLTRLDDARRRGADAAEDPF